MGKSSRRWRQRGKGRVQARVREGHTSEWRLRSLTNTRFDRSWPGQQEPATHNRIMKPTVRIEWFWRKGAQGREPLDERTRKRKGEQVAGDAVQCPPSQEHSRCKFWATVVLMVARPAMSCENRARASMTSPTGANASPRSLFLQPHKKRTKRRTHGRDTVADKAEGYESTHLIECLCRMYSIVQRRFHVSSARDDMERNHIPRKQTEELCQLHVQAFSSLPASSSSCLSTCKMQSVRNTRT